MSDKKIFAGLKVLDVGSWIAGPVAATILADYGADVIKVERPVVGDQYRILAGLPSSPEGEQNYMWEMDARNKRDLALNLKSAEGIEILHKLIADCDVYVTNQPFPLRRSLKLEYEDVKAIKPDIIYASLTAYGEQGPERDKEGFDLVAYWARTGMMDLVRDRDGAPAIALPGMGDHHTAVSLYASIVTALLHKERTGEGSMVHTSLLGNGVWAAGCIAQAGIAGGNYERYRAVRQERTFTQSVYRTSDDRWLQLTMIRSDEELDAFFTLLGKPDLMEDERFSTMEARFENTATLQAITAEALATRHSDDWMAMFEKANLNVMRVGLIEELVDDEMIYINKIVVPPTDPASTMPFVINHPVNVDALERVGPTRAPELGEHSSEVLAALNYTEAEIEALRAKGVIE